MEKNLKEVKSTLLKINNYNAEARELQAFFASHTEEYAQMVAEQVAESYARQYGGVDYRLPEEAIKAFAFILAQNFNELGG